MPPRSKDSTLQICPGHLELDLVPFASCYIAVYAQRPGSTPSCSENAFSVSGVSRPTAFECLIFPPSYVFNYVDYLSSNDEVLAFCLRDWVLSSFP